jgi:hypothetical protein
MTIPNHLRTALDRVLEYAIPDEQENYEEARHSASEHIYEDMLALRNWLGPVAPAEPRYSLGINNDDGKCYDIAILRAIVFPTSWAHSTKCSAALQAAA